MAKNTKLATQKPQGLAKMEDWEKDLADEAKAEQAKETLGTPRISHKGSQIKIEGKAVEGNRLPLVVLDYCHSRAYYEGEFDPDAKVGQTPVCYAFGTDDSALKPHEAAPDKQAESCKGCPHDAFGSAEKGRGKRCKDERRVMCFVGIDDADSIAKGEMRQFSIPPGSLKNWGNYLNVIKEVSPSGNVRTVLTEMSTEPGEKGAYRLTFKATERLDREFVQALMARRQDAQGKMYAPYPVITEEEPAPKRSEKSKSKTR